MKKSTGLPPIAVAGSAQHYCRLGPGDAGLEGGDESIPHPVCRAVQSKCGVKRTRLTHRKSDKPPAFRTEPPSFLTECHPSFID